MWHLSPRKAFNGTSMIVKSCIVMARNSQDKATHASAPVTLSLNICRSSFTRNSANLQASSTTFSPFCPLIPPKPSCLSRHPLPCSSKAIVIVVGSKGISKVVGSGKRYDLIYQLRSDFDTHDWKIPNEQERGIRPSVRGYSSSCTQVTLALSSSKFALGSRADA